MSIDNENLNDQNLDNLLDDDILSEGEGAVSLNDLKKKKFKLEKKNKILIGLLVFFFFLFSFIYGVNYFFTLTLSNGQKSDFDKLFLDSVKEYILPYVSNIDNNNENKLLITDNNKKYLLSMKQYVDNKGIPFYEKRENKKKYVKKSLSSINSSINSIKTTQQLINKYRYLPKDLKEVLNNSKLMPILITLNSMKIYFINYVFIKLGIFNDKVYDIALKGSKFFRNISGIDKDDLRIYVEEDLNKFREEGVSIYLKDILFNYMYDKNNSSIINSIFVNDFKNRFNKDLRKRFLFIKKQYKYQYLNITFDDFVNNYVLLFGNIYLETNNLYKNKLSTDLLPINIKLLSYDPKKQTLTFSIKLLLGKKTMDGQNISIIDLASKIIYILRESRLIIGKNIKQNELKVNKIIKKIAGQKQYYSNINLSFTTSVQSNVNVEVSDIDK